MSETIDVLSPKRLEQIAIVVSNPRDGHLITGQQQYSGTAVARLVIDALGV